MKPIHSFLFTPGLWIGQGKITFSVSPDHLHFYTKWLVETPSDGIILCRQEVETEGREWPLINTFNISKITEEGFSIDLSNDLLNHIPGKGVLDPKTIAWEFRGNPDFEGFEVYELQDNGDYMLHAEFVSTENFRTIVDGRIWKKI